MILISVTDGRRSQGDSRTWLQSITHLGEKTQQEFILWLKATEPPHGCDISWVASFRVSKLRELNQGL